ncbi:MAG: hypothetical protein E7350_00150 [Clostridiales bacterium]|nr:hypothetical protein [Clostridiales bacterium]
MKKIIVSVLSLLLVAFVCIGCTSNTVTAPEIDDPKPWFASRKFKSETSSYNVAKYFMRGENDLVLVNDESDSHLTHTLTLSEDSSLLTLTTDFRITYSASEYVDSRYHGKTDTITSTAVFYPDTLYAVSTQKNVVLETEPSSSYSYSADYVGGTATITKNGANTEITFDRGNYIDNEYLYYYVRAMEKMGNSLNETFEVVNWYECYLRGEFFTASMVASYFGEASTELGASGLIDGFDADTKDTDANMITCTGVRIFLNSQKQGAPLEAYYSKGAFTVEEGKTAKKLLSRIMNYEYTLDGIINYTSEYKLKDFKTEFLS